MPENPRIIVLSEQLRGQSFDLTKDEHTVGRHEDCDICLQDPTVSNHHCTFVRQDNNQYGVRDEGSTNGTRVNGVRIDKSQKLVNSDIVQVGAIEMLYDSEEKDGGTSASTQTGINIQHTAGTSTISQVPNFSPFGSRSSGETSGSRLVSYIIAGVIGVLIIAVAVALGILLINLFV